MSKKYRWKIKLSNFRLSKFPFAYCFPPGLAPHSFALAPPHIAPKKKTPRQSPVHMSTNKLPGWKQCLILLGICAAPFSRDQSSQSCERSPVWQKVEKDTTIKDRKTPCGTAPSCSAKCGSHYTPLTSPAASKLCCPGGFRASYFRQCSGKCCGKC